MALDKTTKIFIALMAGMVLVMGVGLSLQGGEPVVPTWPKETRIRMDRPLPYTTGEKAGRNEAMVYLVTNPRGAVLTQAEVESVAAQRAAATRSTLSPDDTYAFRLGMQDGFVNEMRKRGAVK